MFLLPHICEGVSAVAFIGYGVSCFASRRTAAEFIRYRLGTFRPLTGVLQVLGGVGLIVGHYLWPVLIVSATGLMLMMLLAVVTRFRIRDGLIKTIPAFSLFILNLYVLVAAFKFPH